MTLVPILSGASGDAVWVCCSPMPYGVHLPHPVYRNQVRISGPRFLLLGAVCTLGHAPTRRVGGQGSSGGRARGWEYLAWTTCSAWGSILQTSPFLQFTSTSAASLNFVMTNFRNDIHPPPTRTIVRPRSSRTYPFPVRFRKESDQGLVWERGGCCWRRTEDGSASGDTGSVGVDAFWPGSTDAEGPTAAKGLNRGVNSQRPDGTQGAVAPLAAGELEGRMGVIVGRFQARTKTNWL